MPQRPPPSPVPADRWADLVKSELSLLEMQADLHAMAASLKSARKNYQCLKRRVEKERSQILALLAQGAEIEDAGRIARPG